MRRVLFLEPVGGIAGDMFMAAAIDLGVRPEEIQQALSGLSLPPWRLEVSKTQRHAITGTHVDVVVEPGHAQDHHRSLADIRRMIDACQTLSEGAKARAQQIFTVIGEAEAKIHAVPVEEVHFHEVGAVDSIVDVCAAALVLELLGNPEVISTPPPLGGGMVRTDHGQMPVPAPATLEILRDVPVKFEGVGELTTPTGAAILKACARVGAPPELVVERIGYGVGTKDFRDRANVLRASMARADAHGRRGADADVWVIEANLDDCSPQLLGALVESSLEAGAMDAFIAPVLMKKSRPGHLFTVITPGERKDALIALLMRESTSIGVRFHRSDRVVLERRIDEVETAYGLVRVKVALHNGTTVNAQPEFEDCRARASAAGVAIKEVQADATSAWRRRNPSGR